MKAISYGILALFLLVINASTSDVRNSKKTGVLTAPSSSFVLPDEPYIDDIPFNTEEIVNDITIFRNN